MAHGEKKYTERDLVLAKREGYVACRREHGYLDAVGVYQREAARKYTLPKVTRPRVVNSKDTPMKYRIRDGVIERAFKGTDNWHRSTWNDSPLFVTDLHAGDVCDLAAIVDVLANPTEEVEDDA